MGEARGEHQAGGTGPDRQGDPEILIEDYYIIPIYWNPFVHAIGPKVLPEGKGFERYYDTLHAPYPWPWEVWEVKADK